MVLHAGPMCQAFRVPILVNTIHCVAGLLSFPLVLLLLWLAL